VQCATKKDGWSFASLPSLSVTRTNSPQSAGNFGSSSQPNNSALGIDFQPVTTCWICSKSVSLETCNIDEQGRAVHGECYAKITL
jgi:hypothetical protein